MARLAEDLSVNQAETHTVSERRKYHRALCGFWLLGVLNNSSYVIMIAAAKSISNGGVAMVYIAAILPGTLVKASSTFWFDKVGYQTRLVAAGAFMAGAFAFVGPLSAGQPALQFLGVALCSLQSSLGEASLLALSSRYPRRGAGAVAAWSSGTGFAGVLGYGWVLGLTVCGLSQQQIQTLALLTLPPAFLLAYFCLLRERAPAKSGGQYAVVDVTVAALPPSQRGSEDQISQLLNPTEVCQNPTEFPPDSVCCARPSLIERPVAVALGWRARVAFALSLWPVTGAIFTVYFSEYAMQSGVWAAMGFPVSSQRARDTFYELSNWSYQCGVLVSRSSGPVLETRVGKRTLWALALAQFFMLAFFALDAAKHWWYDESLLALCFVTGLFGGTIYVHGFRLLAAETRGPLGLRELAMPVGAFASDSGTLLSNVLGLVLQGCLYDANHIAGAAVRIKFC